MSVDASDVQRLLSEKAVEWHGRLMDAFVQAAQQRSSRRSGNLADSIEAGDPVDDGNTITGLITVGEPYGIYQDQGTGIYGPDGGRIYPTSGKVLAFDWPAAGGMVFFASVAGSPGTHFWSDTIDDFPSLVGSL